MDSQYNRREPQRTNTDNPSYVKLIDNHSSQGKLSHSNTPSHDRNLSSSPALKQALYDSDMLFFENMIVNYQEELS